jgi:H+/Cl- antiporter ClcA
MKRLKHHDQFELFSYTGTWLVTASLIALLAGTASALFLLSLDNATAWRESHSWMIWLLPLAGLGRAGLQLVRRARQRWQ